MRINDSISFIEIWELWRTKIHLKFNLPLKTEWNSFNSTKEQKFTCTPEKFEILLKNFDRLKNQHSVIQEARTVIIKESLSFKNRQLDTIKCKFVVLYFLLLRPKGRNCWDLTNQLHNNDHSDHANWFFVSSTPLSTHYIIISVPTETTFLSELGVSIQPPQHVLHLYKAGVCL